MLHKWPIRNKLLIGLGLLLIILGTLSWGGIHGLYAYRELVKSVGRRVEELPLANDFSQRVSDLRLTMSEAHNLYQQQESGQGVTLYSRQLVRDEFQANLDLVHSTLRRYRNQLDEYPYETGRVSDRSGEWATVHLIEATLEKIDDLHSQDDWMLEQVRVGELTRQLEQLQHLAANLPTYLHANVHRVSEEAHVQYRTLIILSWITSITAMLMLAVLVGLFYRWVFRPLRILIKGSRKVAAGHFDYTIQLDTRDEMSELAGALNEMTSRFREIRDDLDRQVQVRTRQAVRSEQLASVGFLAAGVAHEINNPLASIAMCAESLEGRVDDLLVKGRPEHDVIRNYLRMIQEQAFRCKEITEKLLDFSRLGEARRAATDVRELVQGVLDMVKHLGKYQHKHVVLSEGSSLLVDVNPQEIKQVLLNVIINGLDSLDTGGTVRVDIAPREGQAELSITDDGCGMTAEVLEHLFEPFFTRRRGGQGTGLGLSIAYRIVVDHQGALEATSAGPGCGSQFKIRLPLTVKRKEKEYRYQAA